MSDDIKIDLDPKKVLAAVEDMGKEIKALAAKIEEALGQKAPKSIEKLEDAAEKGSTKIAKFFRNLGQQVKEDLKTAFDIGALASGLKIGKDFAEGTKQVFEMERAFDRLNTRLQLSGKQLTDFKKELGKKVANTGQDLKDVLPGVETVAARGGLKAPDQLENIGEILAKVRATTGEGTESLAETVVDILKNQGQKITAANFKNTIDALQGTRTSGAFKTAGDAGKAVNDLAPYAQKLGLSTRDLGGLAAQAGKAGPAGQDILRQLLERGTSIGGQEQLNALFGQKIFNKGKLDAKALGNVDQNKFGQYSQQILQETTGLTGANGADLKRFLESFKGNLKEMDSVTRGAEETSRQFDQATDNFATSIDRFKENAKEAGREIGGSLSKLGGDLVKGRVGNLAQDAKEVGKALFENKGTAAAGFGIAAAGALLAGGAAKRLAKKIPGGDMLGGMAGAELAKAAGIQPVYVTNASEIGMGSSPLGGEGVLEKLKGLGGKISAIGGTSVGSAGFAATGGAAALGALIGVGIGEVLLAVFPKLGTAIGDTIFDALHGKEAQIMDAAAQSQMDKGREAFNQRNNAQLTPEQYAKAVEDGTLKAHRQASKDKPTSYSNPSAVSGRGRSM